MLRYKDRVKCTTTTTGTGTYTFGAAQTGYQSFSVLTDGDTCFYTVTDGTSWEVNKGVKSSSTLTRATLIASSTGSAINWGAGSKDIFLSPPSLSFNDPQVIHVYSQDDLPTPTSLAGFTLPVILPDNTKTYYLHDMITTTNPIHWGGLVMISDNSWYNGIIYTGATDAAFVGDSSQAQNQGWIYGFSVSFTNAGGKLFKSTGACGLFQQSINRDGSAQPTVSPASYAASCQLYYVEGGDNSNAYTTMTGSGSKLTIYNYDSYWGEPYYTTFAPYIDVTGCTGLVANLFNNRFNVADAAKFVIKATNDANFANSTFRNNFLDPASAGGFETGIDYTSATVEHNGNRNIINSNKTAIVTWQGQTATTTNSGAGTYVTIAGTTTLQQANLNWDNNGGANNSLRWIGKTGTPVNLRFNGNAIRATGSANVTVDTAIYRIPNSGAGTPVLLYSCRTTIYNAVLPLGNIRVTTTATQNDVFVARMAMTADMVIRDAFLEGMAS